MEDAGTEGARLGGNMAWPDWEWACEVRCEEYSRCRRWPRDASAAERGPAREREAGMLDERLIAEKRLNNARKKEEGQSYRKGVDS